MTATRRPMQIPSRNSNHIDREPVLATAQQLVTDSAGNVTVVFAGLPGIGKTATASELAHRLRDRYVDGLLFCTLSEGADHEGTESEVLAAFLSALGDRPEDIPDRLDARHGRYLTRTAGLRLLVVLDGAMTAGQVRRLRPADGKSLTVVTERNPATDLSVGGAKVFELDPLSDSDALDLLGRIVGAERIAEEQEAAARIVALCDNLPFAICVIGSLLAQHPRRRIGVLASALNNEHRRSSALSLSQVFDAAYRSLSGPAVRCYCALGARTYDGWIQEATLGAVVGLADDEITWAMMELADRYLVTERDGGYRVREMVRVHARGVQNRADASLTGEEDRMLAYYDRRIIAADVLLAPGRPWRTLLFPETDFPGPDTAEFENAATARSWLRSELSNINVALIQAFDDGRDELVARWCVLLWSFHEKDKHLGIMRTMHDLGIGAAHRSGRVAVDSLIRTQLGFRSYWLRDLADAAAAFEGALRVARLVEAVDIRAQLKASALEGLGLAQLAQREIEQARTALRHNYELAAAIGDVRRNALAALHLAKVEEPDRAYVLLDAAAHGFTELSGDETENHGKVLTWRGRKLVEQNRFDEAEQPLLHALEIMRSRHRRFDEAEVLVALGDRALGLADQRSALGHYRAGLGIYTELCFAEQMAEVEALIVRVEQGLP
ncbi:NB-ARC domain-containing protein [Nocardia sp. CA-128927]|uniref:NB-ARC domain-containing protein n=1 Tax=Nocardia sp. CA-128927 TaxID=3239975 RepID=UPI003D96BE4C